MSKFQKAKSPKMGNVTSSLKPRRREPPLDYWSPVAVPYEVIARLYISEFPLDINSRFTHILNMCTQPHPPDPTRTYHQIPIHDIDNIKPHIHTIITFIDKALREENGIVLVHCHAGVNRSASAIVAYLCHRNGWTAAEARRFITVKKPNVEPSVIFLKQIDEHFGRISEIEDPLFDFHKNLKKSEEKLRVSESWTYVEV